MRPLRLEYRAEALRAAEAWLIVGGEAGAWLGEITRWGIDDARCRLYVLPRSRGDRAAGAVLVETDGQRPRVTPQGAAFGTVAGKIFLPVNASLLPAATEAELTRLVTGEALVFHPALGAVACTRALAVAELLRGPAELDEPFAERPAVRLAHPRIEAIGFRAEGSPGDLLEEMRGEIGTQPAAELEQMEPEPGDGPLARGWRKALGAALHGAERLLGPGSEGRGQSSGPFGKMREWVEQRLRALGDELERLRDRELHRLLKKLETDPDEGLRFALPLHGPPGRGVAPPSAQLGARSRDFNLQNLRGGRAVDAWNVGGDLQRALRDSYLRAAERERRLGRFRRAAYIHAELLRDLGTAALVLKEGRHWREAALLYRDHLGQAREAARCFVEARLLPEALELLTKERAWEELAELYLRLGDPAAARETWRTWADELICDRRPLEAADVLLRRLEVREEALTLLRAQWPDGPAADACVQRLFDFHAEAGDHEAALEAVDFLARCPRPGPNRTVPDWLLHVAREYPDRDVRLAAEETGRGRIAERMSVAPVGEKKRLVAQLGALVSEDRLLPRDVQRFTDGLVTPTAPAPAPAIPPAATRGKASLTLSGEYRLPFHGIDWVDAVPTRRGLVLAGQAAGHVAVCRVDYDGAVSTAKWFVAKKDEAPRLILASPGEHLAHTFLAMLWGEPLPVQKLDRDRSPDSAVGTPPWAERALAAAMGPAALWLLRAATHGWTISGHLRNGELAGVFPVNPEIDPEEAAEIPPGWLPGLVACQGQLVMSCPQRLVIVRSPPEAAHQVVACDGLIVRLVAGSRWGVPHVAVVMPDAVDLCWLKGPEPTLHPGVRELTAAPVAGFTKDGTLVVIAGEEGYVIEADSNGRRNISTFQWSGSVPVAILPGPYSRMFAIVERANRVTVWKV